MFEIAQTSRRFGLQASILLVVAPVWLAALFVGVAVYGFGLHLSPWQGIGSFFVAGCLSTAGLITVRRMWVAYIVEVLARGHGVATGNVHVSEATGPKPALLQDPLGHIETSIIEIAQTAWSEHEELRLTSELSFFDSKLQRGFELAGDEEEALDVLGRSVRQVLPGRPAEILLLGGNNSTFRTTQSIPEAEAAGCTVSRAAACVAVRNGVTMQFSDSEDIDACPRLRGRPGGSCSATCIPVNSMGKAIGVIHATGAVGWGPDAAERSRLDVIAYQAGIRLGMLQTLARSDEEARLDPLTGLRNRRAFSSEAEAVLRTEGPHVVVMADLDKFKILNDTCGHEAGDRALVFFAGLAKTAFRSQDLVSRHGGEEFSFLLAKCPKDRATSILEAFCAEVDTKAQSYGGSPFTVSIGWACSPEHGTTLSELLQIADHALYAAKEQGRNRVVGFGLPTPELVREIVSA